MDDNKVVPEEPIQTAVAAIDAVLNVHENHLYPQDLRTLTDAKERLLVMLGQGFE